MKKVALFLLSNIKDELKNEIKYSEEMFDKIALLKQFILLSDKSKIIKQYEQKFPKDKDIITALNDYPKAGVLKILYRVTDDLEKNFKKSLEKLKKYKEVMPYYLSQNKINMQPQYYSQLVRNRIV
jgi:hypothetical protein